MRETWRMIAGRRDLRLVLSAGIISLTGDWILTIGLIYRVYAVTGSAVASALTMACSFAPQVLLGAAAGVFADRWDRKRTMIAADLLLAVGLLPLLLVRGTAQIWIVFAVMFWEGSVQQFFSPAEQAMVPRLVPDEELLTANAMNGQVSNASGWLLSWYPSAGMVSPKAGSVPRPAGAGPRTARRSPLTTAGAARDDLLRPDRPASADMPQVFSRRSSCFAHRSQRRCGSARHRRIARGIIAAAYGHRMRPGRLLSYGAVAFGLVDLAIFLYPLVTSQGVGRLSLG